MELELAEKDRAKIQSQISAKAQDLVVDLADEDVQELMSAEIEAMRRVERARADVQSLIGPHELA